MSAFEVAAAANAAHIIVLIAVLEYISKGVLAHRGNGSEFNVVAIRALAKFVSLVTAIRIINNRFNVVLACGRGLFFLDFHTAINTFAPIVATLVAGGRNGYGIAKLVVKHAAVFVIKFAT